MLIYLFTLGPSLSTEAGVITVSAGGPKLPTDGAATDPILDHLRALAQVRVQNSPLQARTLTQTLFCLSTQWLISKHCAAAKNSLSPFTPS